jgi:Ca-activated chloride channel family protein
MLFENFQAIHGFWGVIGLLLFYLLLQRRRSRVELALASRELFSGLASSHDLRRRKIRLIFIFASLMLGVLALMRPQIGYRWEEAKRTGLEILIAVDTSRSMMAEDVQPNRLGLAKRAIKNWTRNLQGDRVGLIAFAGGSFMICPLTSDYQALGMAVDALEPGLVPEGSTDLSVPIEEALRISAKAEGKPMALVLFSDGESHTGNPLAAAEKAGKRGLKIFCVGIGTEEGELIPLVDLAGGKEFLKDGQGQIVKSRLEASFLRKIAILTGGEYVPGNGAEAALTRMYEQYLTKMEKGVFQGDLRRQPREWFQIPLLFMVILLCGEAWFSERKEIS